MTEEKARDLLRVAGRGCQGDGAPVGGTPQDPTGSVEQIQGSDDLAGKKIPAQRYRGRVVAAVAAGVQCSHPEAGRHGGVHLLEVKADASGQSRQLDHERPLTR